MSPSGLGWICRSRTFQLRQWTLYSNINELVKLIIYSIVRNDIWWKFEITGKISPTLNLNTFPFII